MDLPHKPLPTNFLSNQTSAKLTKVNPRMKNQDVTFMKQAPREKRA